MTLIPPYDHPDVIAGQGTAWPWNSSWTPTVRSTRSMSCLGGGGLTSGCALAARALVPQCKVHGVEPEAGNDGQQSFRKGEIVHIPTRPRPSPT